MHNRAWVWSVLMLINYACNVRLEETAIESNGVMAYKTQGLWTSAEELEGIPMNGPAWNKMLEAADSADGSLAYISDQEYINNVQILAAAIVFVRTGNKSYKNKVVTACQKLEKFTNPTPIPNTGRDDYNRTLAWGRETAAYVLAADLVGYKSHKFELFCRNVAENWKGKEYEWTLKDTFIKRPNNWGSHAFSSLVAIYSYLGDKESLDFLYEYKVHQLSGTGNLQDLKYGDLCWQADESIPFLINPKGAIKEGVNIDGLAPDDMRRGGCLSASPKETGYAWEFLQGELLGTRVLNRMGYPIYSVADSAYSRAVEALQVRLSYANHYWFAHGDDEAQILFWDEAFGTNYAAKYDSLDSRLYSSCKSFGWAYITLGDYEGN